MKEKFLTDEVKPYSISRELAALIIGVSEVTISVLCKKAKLSKHAGAYIILNTDIPLLQSLRGKVGNHTGKARVKK